MYRKGRYVLSEPKPTIKSIYINTLRVNLLGNHKVNVKLREAFKEKVLLNV